MLYLSDTALLVAEIAVYFSVMALLFRARHQFGIGIFVCALGTMHFLETYLASVLYVQVASGIVISPGSTVLFTGKLVMLLLVYVREDAATVRQPIYGLLIGNFLMVALVMLLRHHEIASLVPNRVPDFTFIDEMGWLMAWGTMLLFVDSILIILVYERTGRWFRERITLRIWLSAALVLTIDQIGFFAALYLLLDMPFSVMVGGWTAKMATAAIYSVLTGAYLRWIEAQPTGARQNRRLTEVFETLTYRKRYEALLKEHGRDGLTGAFTRSRYDLSGPEMLSDTLSERQTFSLIVLDIDHFKRINDQFGHAAGDRVLRQIAQTISGSLRDSDFLYRYGGEEFVVLCRRLPHSQALLLAERLRREVASCTFSDVGGVTISAGVATAPDHGSDFLGLFNCADERLYRAKASGRDRVVGEQSRTAA